MFRPKALIALALSAAVALTACAGPAPAPAAPSGPPPATVKVADTNLGKILVADNGMTLYMFTKDTTPESTCYDQCEKNWPPLLTNGDPKGVGIDAKLLGTTKRKDGSMQVTVKGMPVYFWAKDKAVGDTTGQDVNKAWYVLSPTGEVIK